MRPVRTVDLSSLSHGGPLPLAMSASPTNEAAPAPAAASAVGGPGDDSVQGTAGDDVIWGGGGDDNLYGSDGDDTLYGEAGDDNLSGGDGSNTLFGGDGDDILGSANSIHDSWFYGGEGNDYATVSAGDTFDGGAGFDSVIINSPVDIDLTAGTISQPIALTSVEGFWLWGSSGRFKGSSATEWVVLTGVGTAEGMGGDDDLSGGAGTQTLNGGDGDDRLNGGDGDDHLYGGAGADTFVFQNSDGRDIVYDFNPAEDRIGIVNGAAYTWDQEGQDVRLVFSASHSVLFRDVALADMMSAMVFVATDETDNIVNGTAVDDVLDGRGGQDKLFGLGGADLLIGGEGSDELDGGEGDDTLEGGANWDTLRGGDGADVLRGGGDGDTLIGGAGDDLIDGGGGGDSARYTGSAGGVTVDLRISGAQDTGGAGVDTLIDIEHLYGSDFIDTLTGNEDGNYLFGGLGSDVLSGGDGNDTISGDATDTMDGCAGVDGVWFTTTAALDIDMNLSAAGVLQSTGSGSFVNFETISVTAGAGADRIIGIAGPGGGVDDISGGGGNDWLEGGWGADYLTTGTGVDTVVGGAGQDQINVAGSSATIIYRAGDGSDTIDGIGGSGADVIRIFGYRDYTIRYDTGYSSDLWIVLDNGTEIRVNDGGNFTVDLVAENEQTGTAADETFIGTDHVDDLYGLGGADILDGGGGEDSLDGGAGDDILTGGLQDDILTGRDGHDLFIYGALDGNDVITDFTAGGVEDQLILRGIYDYFLVQDGADVVLYLTGGFGENTVRLQNVSLAAMTAADIDIEGVIDGRNNVNDVLGGTEGDDVMTGLSGNDVLSGLGGADVIYSGQGTDTIDGGAGDDHLIGSHGATTFIGGQGDDLIDTNSSGADIVRFAAGDGNDTVTGLHGYYGSLRFEITGYDRAVVVQEGSSLRVIFDENNSILLTRASFADLAVNAFNIPAFLQREGSPLADVMQGGAARDRLLGGDGNDTLKGEGEGDELLGQGGDDVIEGGVGADLIDGGDGFDTADFRSGSLVTINLPNGPHYGAAGGDSFVSIERYWLSAYNDRFTGSALDETVEGRAGADDLKGGAGDDRLAGGTGVDTLDGGAGDDVIVFAAGDGHDVVNGFTAGGSEDRIEVTGYASATMVQEGANLRIVFDANNSLLLNNVLAASFRPGDINIPVYSATDTNGTSGNDTLVGTSNADVINGLAGNDTLSGAGGDDTLRGGDGNDTLRGGLGADYLDGGAGTDVVTFTTAASGLRINLETNVHVGAEVVGDSFLSVETFLLGGFNDNFTGSAVGERIDGLLGNDVLNGLGGDDTLNGGDGDDTLNAGEGDDRATGGNGNDRIDGGLGADILTGSAGDDYLHGRDGNDILDGGAGADTLIGGYGVDVANYRLSAGAVHIDLDTGVHGGDAAGDTFNSIEYFVLSNHDDTIVGSWASDIIRGMAGDDVMFGGDRHDGLNGGDGADTLNGGTGRDTLQGEKGNDVMTGGADADWFWLGSAGTGNDSITDFEDGLDKIRITNVTGVDDFSDLTVSANGAGWAVITLPDGSSLTLEGVAAAAIEASDFLWT